MSSSLDGLPNIGAPGKRALQAIGYATLRDLARIPRADLSSLHGMGPTALGNRERALTERGLRLR